MQDHIETIIGFWSPSCSNRARGSGGADAPQPIEVSMFCVAAASEGIGAVEAPHAERGSRTRSSRCCRQRIWCLEIEGDRELAVALGTRDVACIRVPRRAAQFLDPIAAHSCVAGTSYTVLSSAIGVPSSLIGIACPWRLEARVNGHAACGDLAAEGQRRGRGRNALRAHRGSRGGKKRLGVDCLTASLSHFRTSQSDYCAVGFSALPSDRLNTAAIFHLPK